MKTGFSRITEQTMDGGFTMVEAIPARDVRRLVLRYQGFEASRPLLFENRQPAGLFIPLIVNFGARWTITSEGDSPTDHDSFAAGLIDRFTDIGCHGNAACLQIDLTPFGARAVLGLPLGEIAESVVPLIDLLGTEGQVFIERLAVSGSWQERLALADQFVRGRLHRAPLPDRRAAAAWKLLARTRGAVRIGDLATRLECSREHLTRQFREHVGHSPKTVARIMRFQHARTLAPVLGYDWSAIAHQAGFADQAHLIRDFRRMAGMTPAAWATSHSFNTGGP